MIYNTPFVWLVSEGDHRVSLTITRVDHILTPLTLPLWTVGLLKPAAAVQISHPGMHAWERVLSPPAVPPPCIPRPLPAIYRANLKLHYYDSCTQCVGGRFRTSTPSINPPMGPTSWLNRPVPVPDNLSSDEAKLRSCNYSQNFLLSVSPLAKNLFWRPFNTSLKSGHLNSKQPLYQNLYNCLGFSRLMVLILQQTVLVTVLAITFAGKISCALSITNVSPFALCGSLRWLINHQNIWPTNKQTKNMQWRNHES